MALIAASEIERRQLKICWSKTSDEIAPDSEPGFSHDRRHVDRISAVQCPISEPQQQAETGLISTTVVLRMKGYV